MPSNTNYIDVNNSGITVDWNTGRIGFPYYKLFQFFSEELKNTHDVSLEDGKIVCREKVVLYGEGGRAFAKDLPFFRIAINAIPHLRNIGSAEGFCKNLLQEIPMRYIRGLTESDITAAKRIAAGDYIVIG